MSLRRHQAARWLLQRLSAYAVPGIDSAAAAEQQEVRRHVAQLLARVPLTADQRRRAAEVLLGYLDDPSSIVRTFAMQTLADLAVDDAVLHARVLPIIEKLTATGTPAMWARGRKLPADLLRERPVS